MSAATITRWYVLLALIGLFVAPVFAIPTQFFLNGYVQARYTDELGPDAKPESFDVKRAYLFVRATTGEHTGATLLLSGISPVKDGNGSTETLAVDVSLLEAYGEYIDKPFSARLGLSRIPFGYEIPLTSSRLIALERSQILNLYMYPYTFDRGAFGYYLPGKGFNVALAAINGTPVNVVADPNSRKNFVGRVGHSIPGGEAGVSLYNGRNPRSNYVMNLVDVDAETKQGPFTILGEYVTGKTGSNSLAVNGASDSEVDSNGGYVTVAYQQAGSQWQPYVRYDVLDPNTDAGSDYFKRLTTGLSYFLNPTAKLTLEYQSIQDETNPGLDGFVGFQYQVVF